MPYVDRQKALEYKRRWNKKYYNENKNSEKRRVADRKKKIATWLNTYKSALECTKCGENSPVCLDFHHIDEDNKDKSLAMAIKWGWGLERIKNEIGKCVVLCSNCHRKIHAEVIKL